MISKAIRAAAVLLATLAIPAAVLIAPLPASAANSGSMCDNSGIYCLNTANFNLYTPVTESAYQARTIDAVVQRGTTYKLVFHGDTSKCVAATNDGTKVEVKACNGSDGVLWTRGNSNGADVWINQAAKSLFGVNYYLTGRNQGNQFVLAAWGAINGGLQRFIFV